MLKLIQIEEIENKLSELPQLIDEFEARDMNFHAKAKEWLRSLEKLLANNGMSQASEISLLRAGIAINSRRRIKDVPSDSRKNIGRTARDILTANIIQQAGEKVNEVIRKPKSLIDEGESIARQIAAVAIRKNIHSDHDGSWEKATEIWNRVFSDPDLINASTHLIGIVGRINAILIFSKVLNEV